jgi:mono/diheme cytochrome c family protein
MPRFAWRLSDKEVADVVSFIRTSWGNGASPVSSADVAKIRKSLQLRQASARSSSELVNVIP